MSVLSFIYCLAWIVAFQVILAAKNEIITKVGKGTYSCEEKLEFNPDTLYSDHIPVLSFFCEMSCYVLLIVFVYARLGLNEFL